MANANQYRMLNITAGLRKVIYDINPHHLYCPYKAAFEKWAIQVLTEEEIASMRRDPVSNSVPKICLLSSPILSKCKPTITEPRPSCGNSYKSGQEGWLICPSFHDTLTPKTFYRSILATKHDSLLDIRNYQTKSSHTKASPRVKDNYRRAPVRHKNSPQLSVSPVKEELDDMDYSTYNRKTRRPQSYTSYTFKIDDTPAENMKRYRTEYTYGSSPFKSISNCRYMNITPASTHYEHKRHSSADTIPDVLSASAITTKNITSPVGVAQMKLPYTMTEMLSELGTTLSSELTISSDDHIYSPHSRPRTSTQHRSILPLIDDGKLRKYGSSRLSDSILYIPDIANSSNSKSRSHDPVPL